MAVQEALNAITELRFRTLCEGAVGDMERLHVPGLVVAALHEGQEQIAGFGVTSVEHPLPVHAETLFQIGSITKTFTGTLAVRLVEQGLLDLDAPVRDYLPGLRMANPGVAERVTMRHLLTHTGGWVGDYFNDFGSGDEALATMVEKVAELPQLTPLSEIWSYNNAGFYLAGRVIEVLTGRPFEAAIQEAILEPLGMKRSFFFAHDVITHRFVVGHEIREERASVARPWAIGRAAHPAGGLICTAGDLFRYARFQMGDGTTAEGARLLTPESLAQMRTPHCAAGGINQMGLTWFLTEVDGTQIISHGGGTNGQITQLSLVPECGFAVVVLTNANKGGQITTAVVKSALRHYLGVTLPQETPIESPVEELAPYVGQYSSSMTELEVTVEDGVMVLQSKPKGGFPTPDAPPGPTPPPVKLALYAADRVVGLEEPSRDLRGEFLRDSDGRIAWLRVGGRIHARHD